MFVLRCAAAWGPSGGLDHTLIKLMGGAIAIYLFFVKDSGRGDARQTCTPGSESQLLTHHT